MTMGERIRSLRQKKGLTQEQLGEILGLQKAAINKYENGNVENIKRSTIKKMSELFGVSPCFIMCWEDENTALTPSAPLFPTMSNFCSLLFVSSATKDSIKQSNIFLTSLIQVSISAKKKILHRQGNIIYLDF